MEIDRTALEAFALALVRTPSPSGEEGDVAALVRTELERLGYAVEVDALGNVTGTLDAGPGPCVLFDAHMDTVGVTDPGAWSADPAGEVRDGLLYGRGAMDMKGPLAALVHGVAAARRSGRVVVCASIAEEMIEGFATVEVARRVQPGVAVICEATGGRVVVGQRGRAELIVEVHGRPTHSSRPELGVNAVEAMADVLRAAREIELPRHDVLGPAILVPTDVISRPFPALSVVPDLCTVTFDRRTLPGETEEQVVGELRAAAEAAGATVTVSIGVDRFDSYSGARVEAPNFAPAWYAGPDDPVARIALAAVGAEPSHWAFCTNGSGTAALGIPTIGYGPGDETLAHRVDEHIELDQLHAGARGYAALAAALTDAS
ncbi:MAG: YgeY family selenium metabolism-linked hydrolase [Solirubrobacteraceae bacterium]